MNAEETRAYLMKKFEVDPNYKKLPISLRIMRRTGLTSLFAELGFRVGAEIGVDRGEFSAFICEANPGVRLYAVDPWEIYKGYADFGDEQAHLERHHQSAIRRFRHYRKQIRVIQKYSMDAVHDFAPECLDFVYIDGNHSFEYVMEDIIEWSKRIRSGGIVSGHDWCINGNPSNPFHVIQATSTYAACMDIKPWFILRGDRCSSWMWVKP